MRLLPIERIPSDLWGNNLLHLPAHLSLSYLTHLDRLGLKEKSVAIEQKDVHGGKTLDETHDHFARRFAVSSGRLEYSTLGPCEHFGGLSEAFLSTFSDGLIGLLDIPGGTGAMSAALVSTLTRLREEGVLPRLPLTISICAGDYSPEALAIFELIMHDLVPPASAQGITVMVETHDWDATRGDQTAHLVDRWFAMCAHATEFFVVVSNFSGALHSQSAFDAFSPCLEHVLSRLHDKQSTLVWIEPASKSAKKGLLVRLTKFFTSRARWFAPTHTSESITEAFYQVEHPVNGRSFDTNIVVHRFERT